MRIDCLYMFRLTYCLYSVVAAAERLNDFTERNYYNTKVSGVEKHLFTPLAAADELPTSTG